MDGVEGSNGLGRKRPSGALDDVGVEVEDHPVIG
jgi:hypothetical protein